MLKRVKGSRCAGSEREGPQCADVLPFHPARDTPFHSCPVFVSGVCVCPGMHGGVAGGGWRGRWQVVVSVSGLRPSLFLLLLFSGGEEQETPGFSALY